MSVLWGRLPTGQWGTPSYSQPDKERQLYGEKGTLNIENHVWGPNVLFRDK